MRKRRNDKGRFSPFAFPIREVLCACRSSLGRMPMRSNAPLTSDQRTVRYPNSHSYFHFLKALSVCSNSQWQMAANSHRKKSTKNKQIPFVLRYTIYGRFQGRPPPGASRLPRGLFLSLGFLSLSCLSSLFCLLDCISLFALSFVVLSLVYTHDTRSGQRRVSCFSSLY